jgi:hypothetical protein
MKRQGLPTRSPLVVFFLAQLLAAAGASGQQGPSAIVVPVGQCQCKCAAMLFEMPGIGRETCGELNGSDCQTSGGGFAQLEQCRFVFVEPPAAPGAPAAREENWICEDERSWERCEDQLLGVPVDEDPLPAAETAKATIEDMQQDLALGNSSPSGASVKDNFLHRFFAAFDIPGLSEQNGLLSFRYNTPNGILGIEAAANEPEVFEKLALAIPEAERATKVAELEKGLDSFDDISFKLSVNIQPPNTMVNRKTAIDDYVSGLMQDAVDQVAAADQEATEARRAYFLKRRERGIAGDSPVEAAADPVRQELEGLLQAATDKTAAADESFAEKLDQSEFFKLADLMANQPQFRLDVNGRSRNELIGPDYLEAALVFELGLGANFNMLMRRYPTPSLENLQKFLAERGDMVENKWRVKFEASYKETDAYDSPVEGVTLRLDKDESLIAKATLGKVMSYTTDAMGMTIERNSFALEASYEDVTGDPERQNRFVATATLTQRATDDMSLELTAVYANKPEYRGEVDAELGARAGIRYKFNAPPAPAQN